MRHFLQVHQKLAVLLAQVGVQFALREHRALHRLLAERQYIGEIAAQAVECNKGLIAVGIAFHIRPVEIHLLREPVGRIALGSRPRQGTTGACLQGFPLKIAARVENEIQTHQIQGRIGKKIYGNPVVQLLHTGR